MSLSTLFSLPVFTVTADHRTKKNFKPFLQFEKDNLFLLLETVAREPWDLAWDFDTNNDQVEWSNRVFNRPDVFGYGFRFQDGENIDIHTTDKDFIKKIDAAILKNRKLKMSIALMKTNQYRSNLRHALKNRFKGDMDLIKEEFKKVGLEYPSVGTCPLNYNYPDIDLDTKNGNLEAANAAYYKKAEGKQKQQESKTVFDLPDTDSRKVAFTDLKVWQWLDQNGYCESLKHHSINTRYEYLLSIGFDLDSNKIKCTEDNELLRMAIDHHFYINKGAL